MMVGLKLRRVGKVSLFLFLLSVVAGRVCGQAVPGYWLGVQAKSEINKVLDYAFEIQDRVGTAMQHDKLIADGAIFYKYSKKIRLGMGYRIALGNASTTDFFSHRIHAEIRYREKVSRWQASLRSRVQISNPYLNTDKAYDAGYYYRQKLGLSYNIKKCKWTPELSGELFCNLQSSPDHSLDKVRYTLGVDRKISKQWSLSFYYLFDQELNEAYNQSVLGVSSLFRF